MSNMDDIIEMINGLIKEVDRLHSGNVVHQKTHLKGTLTWWRGYLQSKLDKD